MATSSSAEPKLAVLFSGEGSNLQNLITALHRRGFSIEVAITNNPEAPGIQKARESGIPCEIIDHRLFDSREAFDAALVKCLQRHQPDLTVLAGFMRILTQQFISQIKAINIHPSLLPLFRGAQAMKESYESPMKVAGVTVHWVSQELDSGEIIAQRCLQKNPSESFELFQQRVHALEHVLYPEAIREMFK